MVVLSAAVIFIFMTLAFILATIKKRNDIADVAWGIGFILVAIFNTLYYPQANTFAISFLTSIWGFRLASHIYKRNKNKPEDFRYQQWRNEWGKFFLIRSYLQVFLLQGFFMLLISMPIILAIKSFSYFGLIVWLIGFAFESIGDQQLANFIKDPQNKGKVMDQGLWAYTRHPNYFGEVTMWWGIWLISGNPLAIIVPLTISFLIIFVSGIPLLEKKYENDPLYKVYKSKTSIFFPIPSSLLPKWPRLN